MPSKCYYAPSECYYMPSTCYYMPSKYYYMPSKYYYMPSKCYSMPSKFPSKRLSPLIFYYKFPSKRWTEEELQLMRCTGEKLQLMRSFPRPVPSFPIRSCPAVPVLSGPIQFHAVQSRQLCECFFAMHAPSLLAVKGMC